MEDQAFFQEKAACDLQKSLNIIYFSSDMIANFGVIYIEQC